MGKLKISWIVRIAGFCLFMLPLVSQALQIEFGAADYMPIHWLFVVQAAIGAGIATVALILRDIFKTQEDLLNDTIGELNRTIETNELKRYISERNIVINSYKFNDEWLKKNQATLTAEKLVNTLKDAESLAVNPDIEGLKKE